MSTPDQSPPLPPPAYSFGSAASCDAVTVGSLCSGYGGLDEGLARALGIPLRHAWHVEYDADPSAVLAHHWPDVPNYGDVKTAPWDDMEWVHWLTAGYPCQPFSGNGLRLGDQDERHLWPYVAQAIGALRPARVLLENVDGHRSLGMGTVLSDLASLGYVGRFGVVRASDAGAPHRRERVFIVARDANRVVGTSPGAPEGRPAALDEPGAIERVERPDRPLAPDSDRDGRPWVAGLQAGRDAVHGDSRRDPDGSGADVDWGALAPAVAQWEAILGRRAPRPAELDGADWRLSPRFVEWVMGLPAGWVTDVPGLSEAAQLKALGNGVVPQQAALAVSLLCPDWIAKRDHEQLGASA